ncbi:MAG: hypothetical protein DMF96_27810 [Acidobacteria bacterium]|nr:MAG: hypothetical protein DMF96_27810 [Acidobacteriota bacterium]
MRRGNPHLIGAAVLVSCLTLAAQAAAQQGSGIAGVVRDDSGAVLPGVTVEAASPALIEKTRSAITDGAGQYKIVNELTTNFTAQVNADLKVGALEESVTVSGASPLVDVQSAQVSQQVTRPVLDAIPTGRSVQAIGKVLPGITTSGGERGGVDVGGTAGFQSVTLNSHGSRGDNVYQIDGMTVQSGIGNGTAAQYYNDGQFEEYTYTTSAIPAEVAYGGVRIQMTSKEGGNAFHGYGLAQIEPWQTSNFTTDLEKAGLRVPDGVMELWDTQVSLGGPIKKDRLWFFTVHRYNGGNFLVGNSFYRDQAVCDQFGTDAERAHGCQGVDDNYELSNVARLTWQATKNHKIAGFYSKENKQRGHRELAAGVSPESSTPQDMRLSYSAALKWQAPLTNKLLWDAGVSQYFLNYTFTYLPGAAAYQNLGYQDLTLSTRWGARPGGLFHRNNYKRYYSASLAYVTGSHALKGGVQYNHAVEDSYYNVDPWHMVAQFRAGAASSVLVDNTPVFNKPGHDESGLFFQDSWTLKRLTINPGIRYDWFHPWVAEQTAPASPWLPERHFAAIDDMLSFKNWSPRFGVIYNLLGNGKTALKANVGKYVAIMGNGQADLYNPLGVLTDQRTWRDINGDLFPQYNEVGPSTLSNFGTRAPRFGHRRLLSPDVLRPGADGEHAGEREHRLHARADSRSARRRPDDHRLQPQSREAGPDQSGRYNVEDQPPVLGRHRSVGNGPVWRGRSPVRRCVVWRQLAGSVRRRRSELHRKPGDPGLGPAVLQAVGAMEAVVQVRRLHAAASRYAGQRDAQQLSGQFRERHLRCHPRDLSGAGADVHHRAARRSVEP